MKKLNLIALTLIFFSNISCKKDYVCQCISAAGYSSTGSTTIHTTKKKAEEICNNTATAAGGGTTCSLK